MATDLSFLKGYLPEAGNWTGNTVNIPGLPSAHIGTDPLPVPFWGNVKPKPPAQFNGQGGGGDLSGWGLTIGGDMFDIPPGLRHPPVSPSAPAAAQNTVQMPTIGGYTLTDADLAALQALPALMGLQTPQRTVKPTVTAKEGDQLPNNAPIYDGAPSNNAQPVSQPWGQGASLQPAVYTMEGDQIPNNAPIYDPGAYNFQPYQIQPNNIGWGGLTQADIQQLLRTPSLPDNSGGFGSGLIDRISSFGNTPHISGDNIGQAAINAGGLFSPIIPALAGLAQGFNLYDPGQTTGNPLADIAGTPGMLQSGVAKAANWVDRLFGGTYMPTDYGEPTVMGPNPDGSAYTLPQAAVPAQTSSSGWGGDGGTYQSSYPDASSFGLAGNLMDSFMQSAGFGGAGYGYGSGASGGGAYDGFKFTGENNGGWGQ